ncbi:Lrp/AsnC family transcriptional regulator [Alphaproteobacteria bacterium LSUCC0719]
MDVINQSILAVLKQNGRIGWGALAAQLGISRQALRKRIERLELKGHIVAYTIITSHDDKGSDIDTLNYIRAFLKIRFSKGNDCFKLSQLLGSYTNIVGSWAVTGDWDMMILVTAQRLEQVSDMREIIVATGGIDEIETDAVLNDLRE